MQLVLKFRNMLPTVVREELDSLVAIIMGFWHVEHNADGSHGNIHVDSITVGGVPIVPGQGGGTATLPTTTKGDLIAHDGVQNVRVPVGSIGRVLQADPSAAPGVSWQIPAPPGTGNVVGPASAVRNDIATYADTTGKVIKDSGVAMSNVPLLNAPLNTFTGELQIAGPAPGDNGTRFTFTDTSQASNQEDWQFININTFLAIRAFDDVSPGNIQQEFRFDRTGVLQVPYLNAIGGLGSTPINPASLTGPVPIAKGGTGATSKVNAFDALSPSTTKGDLIGYNGADNVRVPVGAQGQVLQADSAAAAGVSFTGAPVFPGNPQAPGLTLSAPTPILYFNENDQGADLKNWQLYAEAQTFRLHTLTDAFGGIAQVLTVNRAGGLAMTGTITERGRSVPMGEWINIPYSAGIFTASGAMTYTVAAGGVTTLAYMMIGRTVFVFFNITGAVGGTASTDLFIAVPFNPTISSPAVVRIAGASAQTVLAYSVVGQSKLGFQPFAGGNHTIAAAMALQGMVVCQV